MNFKIRPWPEKASWRRASRVLVGKEALLELTGGLSDGKRCFIERSSKSADALPTRREATLHLAKGPNPLAKSVVQVEDSFRALEGWSLGDLVKITVDAAVSEVPVAETVTVEDITAQIKTENKSPLPPIIVPKLSRWELNLADELARGDSVFPGMVIKDMYTNGQERTFAVTSVNGQTRNVARIVVDVTSVKILQPEASGNRSRPNTLQVTDVAGLETQVSQLNHFLFAFGRKFSCAEQRLSCAMVLQGGHGTGKSLLVERVCQSGWGTVHRIQPRDKLSVVQATFQKARNYQPSIVVLDGLESLIRGERENRSLVIDCIGAALDNLSQDAVEQGTLPQVIVLATCLDYVVDMPLELRTPGRFDMHIFFPLPDAAARLTILSSFNLPLPPDEKDQILIDLSKRTHAYNGTDLKKLATMARYLAPWETSLSPTQSSGGPSENYYIPRHFLEVALEKVRPSSMHDVNLKPPSVRWEDIGGQEALKDRLRLVIDQSREPKEVWCAFLSRQPKGYLLFGPPGCSKTMAAQAMATESDLNFFSVKGPELLNMYVGESERAIRQLFERARANAPSLIFFDEIDTLASSRQLGGSDGGGDSSASSGRGGGGGGHHVGHSVLATLLTEMDGFETSHNVLVLAATNRPQALDSALLRAGRFDGLIYVGPPDAAARDTILRRQLTARRVAPDVDVAKLVQRTEGFSGAELTNVCEAAGQIAFERELRRRRTGTGEMAWISEDDLTRAVEQQPKMITAQMLAQYQAWEKKLRDH